MLRGREAAPRAVALTAQPVRLHARTLPSSYTHSADRSQQPAQATSRCTVAVCLLLHRCPEAGHCAVYCALTPARLSSAAVDSPSWLVEYQLVSELSPQKAPHSSRAAERRGCCGHA